MKKHPDINDTLRTEGAGAARVTVAAHDQDRSRLKHQTLSGP
jgi:hypothetical protein